MLHNLSIHSKSSVKTMY